MDMPEFEHFKETMRKLCTELENLSIENSVYFDLILEARIISYEELKETAAKALLDPERRAEAHQNYSDMWKAVDEASSGAAFEEMLNSLPPTDKPN
ncbi:MAG: hypothetical protein WA738_06170 [Candidatus Angelobacter sp.]